MSTDLKYLAFTAILTASLWIPYVVCQVMTNGRLTPPNYLDPTPRPLPLWGRRADRAYINAVETFAPFAALVIVIHLAGKADAMTAFWATASSGCGSPMPSSTCSVFPMCGRWSSRSAMSRSSGCSGN